MCLLFFFSIIQLTAGLCCRGVRGVNGAVERRRAAPAVVGRLGLVLDTELGFWASRTTDDDETGLPPLNPPCSSNRKPQRNSDFDFRLFAVSKNEHQHPKSRTLFLPTWDFLLTMKPDLIAR